MQGEKGGLNKMGEGFSKEEIISPLYVGPHGGQEGWQPTNPEIGQPRDPLGYLKEHDKN